MQHFGDRIEFIRDYLRAIFAGDVHSKRIDSLAGATLGVMTSASLAVSVIGHALAQARCRLTKHGRATPLLWLTVFKGELKAKRNDYEDLCLLRLAEALPEGAVVTILADRRRRQAVRLSRRIGL